MRWRLGAALAGTAAVAILAVSGAGTLARGEYRRLWRARRAARGILDGELL
jgi:hypothetical protein